MEGDVDQSTKASKSHCHHECTSHPIEKGEGPRLWFGVDSHDFGTLRRLRPADRATLPILARRWCLHQRSAAGYSKVCKMLAPADGTLQGNAVVRMRTRVQTDAGRGRILRDEAIRFTLATPEGCGRLVSTRLKHEPHSPASWPPILIMLGPRPQELESRARFFEDTA